MRRRRRTKSEIENPFLRAGVRVDELERNMIAAMTTVDFTVRDVIEWLWSEEVRAPLEKAYPLLASAYRNMYTESSLPVPNGPTIALHVNLEGIMAVPKDGLIIPGMRDYPDIVEALNSMAAVYYQFEKVRKVIRWFKNSTPGAVRYYWPTMAALLPPEHDIHKADGLRYREPPGISSILPLLRETGGIVTGALLCPKIQSAPAHVMVNIRTESSLSNQFAVV